MNKLIKESVPKLKNIFQDKMSYSNATRWIKIDQGINKTANIKSLYWYDLSRPLLLSY